jgi:PEGA domain
MMRASSLMRLCAFATLLLLSVVPAFAQTKEETGTLKIHVGPKQAYVFVDGNAIRDGSQSIALAPGTHEVDVHNYGFIPRTQKVHIGAGETTDINVALQASGDTVSGPFADIESRVIHEPRCCSMGKLRPISSAMSTSSTTIFFGTSGC